MTRRRSAVIRFPVCLCVLVLSSCGGAAAPTAAPAVAVATAAPPMLLMPANSVPQPFVWVKAPAAYPPGLEIMVVEGDTSKPAPFTLRFRWPDGYALPPHQHPIEEHV